MAFWLFKSEPFKWSFADQLACGEAGTEWSGVRNYQARNFMSAMRIGERGFFYHSNEGKEIVGLVEVSKLAHPDSTSEDPRWTCVDVRALRALPKAVTLEEVKRTPDLSAMMLATNSRLSVQPVTEAEFRVVCRMGGLDEMP
ncbi:EVE domain-containing protein [Aureimonas sp. AU4]|uniref:EVE domain-containing protein n=1 Tax=Aureimonas sp. AU4 TaxID=1638163 RepID=UPI000782A12A|nr:EVE domain-containing protein [Aureimonas sp. AU4]